MRNRLTQAQAAALDAATRWAEADARVRALILKGSAGRGDADPLSDLDLVIVSEPGLRDRLYAERREIAGKLGRPLGLFRDVPWSYPHLVIALYEGPLKVDFYYQDGEATADPWLRDGFTVLVDKNDVAERLQQRLSSPAVACPVFDPYHEDLAEFDANAWDFAWWIHVKIQRGEYWRAYSELTLYVRDVVFLAHNILAGTPWMGCTAARERLSPALLAEIEAALPQSVDEHELRRSLRALIALYIRARAELVTQLDPTLTDELMTMVRTAIEGAGHPPLVFVEPE